MSPNLPNWKELRQQGSCAPLLMSSFAHHIRTWGTEYEGTLWDQESVFWVVGRARPILSEPAEVS